ncbi:MAG TPA: GFA family protein [Steroidobacteraceae bacterium]|jgi:hypothetical protein
MLRGGCFCGFVRYVAVGVPFNESNCHCSICRRSSGAPFLAWFTVPLDGFTVVSGEPASFASSADGERTFCPRCGTPLTFRDRRLADEIDVTLCSLEDPAALSPRDHTFVSSKLPWVKLADGLPVFPYARPPQGSPSNP